MGEIVNVTERRKKSETAKESVKEIETGTGVIVGDHRQETFAGQMKTVGKMRGGRKQREETTVVCQF